MHVVKMSTGSLYPCSCEIKEDHNYSDKSMHDIMANLMQDIKQETPDE